jgi:drug/metabolite transporter (DMT)-like permease
MVATVPLWMALLQWLRGVRASSGGAFGLLLGFVGIVVLIGPGELVIGNRVQVVDAMVLIGASLSWAVGSLYSRRARLPESALLATAMEMLAGGALLILTGLAMREQNAIRLGAISSQSFFSYLYLIVFGSLIGFTAYIWLLRVATPILVSTYAYVNPVVAVFLGAALAGEPVTIRTLLAAVIILTGVALITISGAFPRRT